MNRMAPLITRAATLRPLQPRLEAAGHDREEESERLIGEDLQFFLTAWLASFLFLGTLFS